MRQELLAPAGSYDIFEAVIAAGADAVYLGGEKYSARASAPNFSEKDILRALDFAHIRGKKIYLAVNILLKNRETDSELYRYIKPFYEHGLDAIIVQDYGVFQFVKRYFSDLPVHISTQMSVANVYGAAFLREKGAKRIVAARELSPGEIRSIREEADIEIECFVHGALCYCYSGQCLLSSLIGGRSGNRGRCAQPCRLPYQVQDGEGNVIGREADYPLSLKDLCAAELIPVLSAAGVDALKIEGRMKSLEYAAGVTRIYRELLDRYESDPENYAVREEEFNALLALGNRGGFTEGYYVMRGGSDMLTRTDPSVKSTDAGKAYCPEEPQAIPVKGTVTLCPGNPLRLTVDGITVTGDIVQRAERRPLMEDEVRSQITKTGDTPFVFDDLKVEIYGDCFVPVSRLNALRREALDRLREQMLAEFARGGPPDPVSLSGEPERRDEPGPGKKADSGLDRKAEPGPGEKADSGPTESRPVNGTKLDVMVCTPGQLEEALKCQFADMISLDPDDDWAPSRKDLIRILQEANERIKAAGKQTGYCFPFVFRRDTSRVYEDPGWMDVLRRFDALWVRSFDSLGFALRIPGIRRSQIRLDAGMYVFSEETANDFFLEGIGGYTASAELNRGELSHMENGRTEFTVYGYTPVMVSAQCLYRNFGLCSGIGADGCGRCPGDRKIYLSDRYFNKFYAKKNCADCYNVIYNSRPLYLFHRAEEIEPLGFGSLRISLVSESREQTAAVLSCYGRAFVSEEKVSAPADEKSYTNGHFRRGVE